MSSRNEHTDLGTDSNERELRLLSEVSEDPEATQRVLSQRVGIALGLTNLLLRKLVQRGYVKVSKADWKRRIYSLTPDGFSHVLRLTVSYVSRSLESYKEIRKTLRKELAVLALNSESSVAIYGVGDFAELVYLGLREIGIDEIGIYSRNAQTGETFLGMPVRDADSLDLLNYDRVIIAYLNGAGNLPDNLHKDGANALKVVTFFDKAERSEIASDGH
jgi:DNA-binding MarR family transcriptional regulator